MSTSYISLLHCPICGEAPEKEKESLGRPGGHGYPGHFSYEYRCGCCKLLRGGETSDIYLSPEDANNLARELWNERVESTKAHLDKLYIPRKYT